MSRYLAFLLLCAGLVGGAAHGESPSAAPRGELHVLAAASLAEAVTEIAAAHERETGQKVALNLGASSLLARQLREGAPADLFLSADEAKMDEVDRLGLLAAGTRRNVLSNTLVVVVPLETRFVPRDVEALVGPGLRTLALAEPDSVPAGIYARTYLTSRGVWERVKSRVVPTENVRGALAAVEAGNADAAIVYKTDAQISRKVQVAFEVPRAEGPRILYPFAVLAGASDPEGARGFLTRLGSPAGLEIFKKYGFLTDVPSD